MAPISGKAHIGYLPSNRVVGLSKLVRLVNAFAQRLQVQERLTAEIADTLEAVLQPYGVGVVIQATHQCMTTRESTNTALRWAPAACWASFALS